MSETGNITDFAVQDRQRPAVLVFAWMFIPFSLLALWSDADPWGSNAFISGYWIASTIILTYFSGMFLLASAHLRRLMIITMVLSYIGELLLTEGLHLYGYRRGFVPLFVPFGHSIIYASGYLVSKYPQVARESRYLRAGFFALFIGIFIGQWLFLNDWFTLITGCIFFLFLKRKRWRVLYFILGLHAAWVEIWGIWFGGWRYSPLMFGFIPAANPPLGMVFFYLGGDLLVGRVVRMWEKRLDQPVI